MEGEGRLESHQLSGFSCVSMSTRQIGHFRLVASHWSTQPWWKRCMQGNLLEDGNREKRRRRTRRRRRRSKVNISMIHIDKHESADNLCGNVPTEDASEFIPAHRHRYFFSLTHQPHAPVGQLYAVNQHSPQTTITPYFPECPHFPLRLFLR